MKRFLLLLLWLSLTPCLAQASCGDWLNHSSPGGLDVSIELAASESLAAMTDLPARRTPCNALGCRQAPVDLPAPTEVPTTEPKWLNCMAQGNNCPIEVLLFKWRDSEKDVLDGFRATIERPPKS